MRRQGRPLSRTGSPCTVIRRASVGPEVFRYPNIAVPQWVPRYRGTGRACTAARTISAILTAVSKIITVAAYKGGVGKTTLALELAYLLDAPLIDLDWDKGGATKRWGYQPTETSPLLNALERGTVPDHGGAEASPISFPETGTLRPTSPTPRPSPRCWRSGRLSGACLLYTSPSPRDRS